MSKNHLVIPLDIFNSSIDVFFSAAAYRRWLKKIGADEEKHEVMSSARAMYARITVDNNLYRVIIVGDGMAESPQIFQDVPHEVVHAVFDLLDDIDIPLTLQNVETAAYLTGYLSEKIIIHYLTKCAPDHEK